MLISYNIDCNEHDEREFEKIQVKVCSVINIYGITTKPMPVDGKNQTHYNGIYLK